MRTTPAEPCPPVPFRRFFCAITALLLIYVSYEAFSPNPASKGNLYALDKLLHFGAFAALAVPARLATARTRRAMVGVAVALLVYGVLIELVQTNIPGRDASWHDLLADAAGVAAGLTVATLLARLPALRQAR